MEINAAVICCQGCRRRSALAADAPASDCLQPLVYLEYIQNINKLGSRHELCMSLDASTLDPKFAESHSFAGRNTAAAISLLLYEV